MVTLTSNYKTFLQPETVEKVDELVEENYAIDDILEFIDEYSEQDFIAYYEEYCCQGEAIGYEVVDAYVSEFGISEVANAEEAFVGEYQSEGDFAESYTNEISKVPEYIVVDWDATFDSYLRYDFTATPAKGYGVYIFRDYV